MLWSSGRFSSSFLKQRLLNLSESRPISACIRSYSCTPLASRGWVPPEKRCSRKQLPSVRARRPLINGKTIAFHVNELSALASESLSNSYGLHIDIRHRKNDFQLEHQPNPPPCNLVARKYESDMIVVLDMDECLIHSKFMTNKQDANIYAHQLIFQNHMDEKSHGIAVDSFRVSLGDGTLVHVHVRPGLYEFLQRVCSRYETHIFTAATDVYANAVLDYIEHKINSVDDNSTQTTKFAGRWYRQHCTVDTNRQAYVKDLNNLWPQVQYQQKRPIHDTSLLRRVVLVDNNPISFLSNPENGVLVPSFYTDSNDSTLPKVWDLLQQLEHHDDVRPLLEEKFSLRRHIEALQLRQDNSFAQAA